MKLSAVLSALMGALAPNQQRVNGAERLRGAFGALIGILATALLGRWLVGSEALLPWVIAPMGASAVLLFAVPSSPLAQPWAMLGGNMVAGLVGVSCAQGLLRDPALAAALAVSLSIGLMFALRCIHPPAGAVALTAVVGGPVIHDLGYGFVLYPVLFNSMCLLLLAVTYNRATGRTYPQTGTSAAAVPAAHQVASRVRVSDADIDTVLDEYNQVLDVSRDDLLGLFARLEEQAYRRRLASVRCEDIMTREVVTVEYGTLLEDAWALMQAQGVKALPVVDRARRVQGILTLADFLRLAGLGPHRGMHERLRRVVRRSGRTHSDRVEFVGQVMTAAVQTAGERTPVAEIVRLLGREGHSHVPIVDPEGRLAGIVAPRDLIGALYQGPLAGLGAGGV